jgi:hypothetical protein
LGSYTQKTTGEEHRKKTVRKITSEIGDGPIKKLVADNDNTRTPTQHRALVDLWRATAPNNDSDIIPPPPRYSASPRHKALAVDLTSLLEWRRSSELVAMLPTNWQVDSDGGPDHEDDQPPGRQSVECEIEIRPSVGEMLLALASVDFKDGRYAKLGGGGEPHRVPAGGDVEYGPAVKAPKNIGGSTSPVWRLGGLAFSIERSARTGYANEVTPPLGSLILWRAAPGKSGFQTVEKFGTPKGATRDAKTTDARAAANDYLAALYGAGSPRFLQTNDQYRRILPPTRLDEHLRGSTPLPIALAMAGLPPQPANDNKPALPCGSPDIASSFVGAFPSWAGTPICDYSAVAHDQLAARQALGIIKAQLTTAEIRLLDLAITGQTFQQLGEAFGYSDKAAERRGKRLLLAVTKKLAAILEKLDR